MAKLYYVGFNGYHQCPKDEEGLPRVIATWTSITGGETINACTHRFVVLETNELFKIYGILRDTSTKRLEVLKPTEIDSFGSCDEYMIAGNGKNIWKYNYKDSKWVECKLEFLGAGEKSVWEDAEKILKFSFQQNISSVILLLSNGSVWCLSKENRLTLLFPHDLDRIVDISSGLEHSLLLTESGCVLSFGNGSRGQLGNGDLNPVPEPVQISALEGIKVIKIAAGGWHSCAVSDSGDLFTWGWNNCGQLSAFENGEEIGLTAFPVIAEVGDEPEMKVVDVECGTRHTVATLENGDLYSTGWNGYSQLGIELQCEKVLKFTKCQIGAGEKGKVICGPWYTILVQKTK